MKLSSSHKREISQLWDVATTYWHLAGNIKRDLQQCKMALTSAKVAEYYEQNSVDQTVKDLNVLLAHLSSAAIRLVTIDERLEKPPCARVFQSNYVNIYKKEKKSQEECALWLNREFDNFVHQILRDNAAHIEEAEDYVRMKPLYFARQEVIRNKTVEEIFNAFGKVMTKFEKDTAPIHNIVLSPPPLGSF